VTGRGVIGDLPPITALRGGTSRRGPRRFDRPAGGGAGPRDHDIRHLPRDWPTVERMRPGDELPEALLITKRPARPLSGIECRPRGEPAIGLEAVSRTL
jgi:hypothetical protein